MKNEVQVKGRYKQMIEKAQNTLRKSQLERERAASYIERESTTKREKDRERKKKSEKEMTRKCVYVGCVYVGCVQVFVCDCVFVFVAVCECVSIVCVSACVRVPELRARPDEKAQERGKSARKSNKQ